MASLFRDGQRPPQKALEIIIDLFHRFPHPLYMGVVSLEVGWSLARTQEMMDLLETRGVLRPLTAEEKTRDGYPQVANVYVLIRAV